jgi:hypothetical protein
VADILDLDPAKGPGTDLGAWMLALLVRVQISQMPVGAAKDKAMAVYNRLLPFLQPPSPGA